ncbi:hypothetical protein [Streptomyces sp. HNM0574]|uniref:hypothetical protein n=1 Tax=Streptomyces sp. HNM0574 TaxID=2714954 RepID=UPI00146F16DC|nr:hypothetical protein [Streptomyces sp. HNM0574]NLU70172.1 hypothetical protein [Streptomyces sp. HNM0574]
MDAVRVALLREVLAGTEWLPHTRRFAGALRASVAPHGGGLLLVGTEAYEPWHLAAHLDDEAAWSGRPELAPTLVRHRVPAGAPPRLSVGLGRIEAAGRAETLLVVAPEEPCAGLLQRVHDARRAGATVFALDGGAPGPEPPPGARLPDGTDRSGPAADAATRPRGTGELLGIAHEALSADAYGVDLDTVQHLVSAAAGENGPSTPGTRRLRDRLARLADRLTAPPPARW